MIFVVFEQCIAAHDMSSTGAARARISTIQRVYFLLGLKHLQVKKNTRVASCLPTFRGTERFVYATQYGLYKLLRHVHSVLQ